MHGILRIMYRLHATALLALHVLGTQHLAVQDPSEWLSLI